MTKWYDNIPAPVDANDREIPLDTKVLYSQDGREFFVDTAMYTRVTEDWSFYGYYGSSTDTNQTLEILGSDLYITPPDSWRKLESDLSSMLQGNGSCRYFGNGADIDCSACPVRDGGRCLDKVARDILRRAKELAESDVND